MLLLILALRFGNKRFGQLSKKITKITVRMLSKELRELEINELVKRIVFDSVSVVGEY